MLQEFKIIDNDVVLIGHKISGVVTEGEHCLIIYHDKEPCSNSFLCVFFCLVGEGVSRFSIGDEVVGNWPVESQIFPIAYKN